MRSLKVALLLVAASVAPGFAQDHTQIQKLANTYAVAFNKKDVQAILALHADDAVLLPPDGEMVRGRSNIENFLRVQVQGGTGLKIVIEDVKLLGESYTQVISTFTVNPSGEQLQTKGNQPREITGKDVTLLQRAGSDWKIATHIWNYN